MYPIFLLQGGLHHLIGPCFPNGKNPAFAQIYLFDPADQAKFRLGLNGLNKFHHEIAENLSTILMKHHQYIKQFKTAAEILDHEKYAVVLNSEPQNGEHPKVYSNPENENDFFCIIPDEDDLISSMGRQIVLRKRSDQNRCHIIQENNPGYDAMHYVLFYPFGEDQWHPGLHKTNAARMKLKIFIAFDSNNVTMK